MNDYSPYYRELRESFWNGDIEEWKRTKNSVFKAITDQKIIEYKEVNGEPENEKIELFYEAEAQKAANTLMENVINRMNPLAGMSKGEQARFTRDLDERQIKEVKQSIMDWITNFYLLQELVPPDKDKFRFWWDDKGQPKD